jgi:D-xylose transport system permease protein
MENGKSQAAVLPQKVSGNDWRGWMRVNLRQYTMVIALLLVWSIFTVLTKGIFITPRNLSTLFLQSATVAIVACTMVLVVVAGHIDLSAGAALGFMGAMAAVLMVKAGWSAIPAVLVTLLVGLIYGAWQGYWVAYRTVPAFIVTLGGQLIMRGGILGLTGGNTMSPNSDLFRQFGQGYLPHLFINVGSKSAGFSDFSALIGIVAIILYNIAEARNRRGRIKHGFEVSTPRNQFLKQLAMSIVITVVFAIMTFYLGIPYAILIVMAMVLVFSFVSQNTTFGRYVYAIGGNKEAAQLSGINVKKTNFIIFVLQGLAVAIAGIVYTSRLNAATGGAGTGMELDVIAACIIGGTSTMGGEGTVFGAIIGALVMASLDNGMSLMDLGVTWQYVVKGLVLLLAVTIDVTTRKKQ